MKNLIAMFITLVLWCIGCYLQENYFHIESTPWIMWYGFVIGFACHLISQEIRR